MKFGNDTLIFCFDSSKYSFKVSAIKEEDLDSLSIIVLTAPYEYKPYTHVYSRNVTHNLKDNGF